MITKSELAIKLNPRRFDGISAKMSALLGFMLSKRFTNPSINAICITSDNYVLAQHEGDCGFNVFVGSAVDFYDNFYRLFNAAGLTPKENEAAKIYLDSCVQKA